MQTLAFTGTILGWQADYPDLNVSALWGDRWYARSRTSNSDIFWYRFQILHRIASKKGSDLALHSLRSAAFPRSVNETNRLASRGIVELSPPLKHQQRMVIELTDTWQRPVQDLLQRIVRLRDPDYKKTARDRALNFGSVEMGTIVNQYDKNLPPYLTQ